MKANFSKNFKKSYKKRVFPNKSLDKRFEKRFLLFLKNPASHILKNHALKGKMKGLRAFSIAGDIRVVYYLENKTAYFLDIGTHNQVYR